MTTETATEMEIPWFNGKQFIDMQVKGEGNEIKLQLPDGNWIRPLGNYIVLAITKAPEKTKGGIILTDQRRMQKEFLTRLAKVVAMGVTSFMGDQFPFGPWVKPGAWVMYRKYDAQDFDVVYGQEKYPFVILYDDKLLMEISSEDLIDTDKVIGL